MEASKSDMYAKKLYDIKKEIESKLDGLDNKNYPCILEAGFGYERKVIESIESMNPQEAINNKEKYEKLKNEISDKIPNKASGLYIFKENSSNIIFCRWAEFSKNRTIPKPKDKYNKEPDKYDPHIFYTGKSNELISRMMEHIVGRTFKKEGPTWLTTYSLKLSDFIKQNPDFKCQVEVFYRKENEDYDYIILNTIIESIIHDKLKPKLGSSRS